MQHSLKKALLKQGYYIPNINEAINTLKKEKRKSKTAIFILVSILVLIIILLTTQTNIFKQEAESQQQEIENETQQSQQQEIQNETSQILTEEKIQDEEQTEDVTLSELIETLEKQGVVIKITNEGFDKTELSLKKDQTISFVNADNQTHKIFGNLLFTDGLEIESLNAISLPLEEKGMFEFYEENHPEIKVKIIVE